jgi:hypothetical protein
MGDGKWTTEPFTGIVGEWERGEFNSANAEAHGRARTVQPLVGSLDSE